MASCRYEVTDEEWERVKGYLPTARTGRPLKDHRQMLKAMMWLTKSGTVLEDLPQRYGLWKTVYTASASGVMKAYLQRSLPR